MRTASIATFLLVCCPVALAVPVAQREFAQVLNRTPDTAYGAQLYETCAACHGRQGEGVNDGTVPAIAGQSFNVIAKQIVDFRAGERRDPRMAHFTGSRTLAYSQHVADVAAYIATLPTPQPTAAPVDSTRRGEIAYERNCERCHGAAAEGNEDTLAPRLASQHFDYLVRQLDDASSGRRPTMQGSHERLIRALSREELLAVARYLSASP